MNVMGNLPHQIHCLCVVLLSLNKPTDTKSHIISIHMNNCQCTVNALAVDQIVQDLFFLILCNGCFLMTFFLQCFRAFFVFYHRKSGFLLHLHNRKCSQWFCVQCFCFYLIHLLKQLLIIFIINICLLCIDSCKLQRISLFQNISCHQLITVYTQICIRKLYISISSANIQYFYPMICLAVWIWFFLIIPAQFHLIFRNLKSVCCVSQCIFNNSFYDG